MDWNYYFIQIIVSVSIFSIMLITGRFLIGKMRNNNHRFLNPTEYLPKEEIQTLKQVYYLIMMLLLFISITNFFFDNDFLLSNSPEFYVFNSVLDIIVSVFIASLISEKISYKNAILIFFLMPLASIAFLIFGESLLEYWDFLRIPAFLFIMKYFYDKFKIYTDRNSLGFSIILLFLIIFFSIIITIFAENEDPLNAIVMVSNAFTSNGYAILGETTGGKINSLILVWSGYILSGVATATLTAGIIMRIYKSRLESYEKKMDEMHKLIMEMKDYYRNKDD